MNFLLQFIICFIQRISTLTISDGNEDKEVIDLSLNNSEVDKLMTKQTEAIKKIVSDTQQIQLEYPDKDQAAPKASEPIKNSTEVNLEDLRIKCQHLERLFRLNNSKFESDSLTNLKPEETSTTTIYKKKFPLTYPVYFQGRRDKTKYSTPKIKGFYVTTVPTETSSPNTTPKTPKKEQPNVKYIKLEPVILQKTFLSNGKVVYYWHKSLPSAINYPNTLQEPEIKPISTTTQPTTTTTASSIYSFRNLFPFYSMSNSDSYYTSTESTTTSTTTTSTAPTPTTTTTVQVQDDTKLNPDFEELSTQLRFVVPVPYMDPENASRNPWDFDQFAYYPKPLQPTKINVQVPYVPTFHYIKALAVPNRYLSNSGNKNVNTEEKPKYS